MTKIMRPGWHSRADAERWWAKVHLPTEWAEEACWEWTACKWSGYGQFRYGGKMGKAHRYGYELYVGPIPDGLDLDHLCRNRGCVNPSHLEAVTRKVNLYRSPLLLNVWDQQGRRTHCSRGHLIESANLPNDPRRRRCWTCYRKTQRGWHRNDRIEKDLPLGTPPPTPRLSHCKRGHEMTDENTYIGRGVYYCRSCRTSYAIAYRQQRRTP